MWKIQLLYRQETQEILTYILLLEYQLKLICYKRKELVQYWRFFKKNIGIGVVGNVVVSAYANELGVSDKRIPAGSYEVG
jgi:hypothetical protein